MEITYPMRSPEMFRPPETAAIKAEYVLSRIQRYDAPDFPERQRMLDGEPRVYGSLEKGYQMVGVRHVYDPESSTAKEVARLRDEYVASVSKEQALFMIEGMHGDFGGTKEELDRYFGDAADEATAVRRLGEKGELMWTARQEGIAISSPEAKDADIIEGLKAMGKTVDHMQLYLTLRQFGSDFNRIDVQSAREVEIDFARKYMACDELTGAGWVSAETRAAVDAAIQARDRETLFILASKVVAEYFDSANRVFAAMPGTEGAKLVPSMDALLKLNRDVPESERVRTDLASRFSDPTQVGSETNAISTEWNRLRDEHLLREIARAVDAGKKPFIVFGGSHAIAVEPALKELFGE